jgi:hypothetical protein
MQQAPALVVHTSDVSHLSRPEKFANARELLDRRRMRGQATALPGSANEFDGLMIVR